MIYMMGGAGWANFGDELIVRYWLEALTARGHTSVIVDGASADTFSLLMGDLFPTTKWSDLFGKLRFKGPKSFWRALERGIRFFENGGLSRYPELSHLQDDLDNVTVVHLHGGGYLNSLWGYNGFLLGVAVALKRRNGARLIGTGLGFGPLDVPAGEAAVLMRSALSEFELIEVRDAASYDLLKDYAVGARLLLGLDDVFLQAPRRAASDRKTLHVSYFKSAPRRAEAIASVTHMDRTRQFDRILFWCCTPDDEQVFEEFAAAVPSIDKLVVDRLVRDPLPVALGDEMLSARFHPHLLGSRLGASGRFVAAGPYYDAKHGSVVALGSPFIPDDVGGVHLSSTGSTSWMVVLDEARVAAKQRLAQEIYGLCI